jgi:hypothetical protein
MAMMRVHSAHEKSCFGSGLEREAYVPLDRGVNAAGKIYPDVFARL